jgi:hypothetical protein
VNLFFSFYIHHGAFGRLRSWHTYNPYFRPPLPQATKVSGQWRLLHCRRNQNIKPHTIRRKIISMEGGLPFKALWASSSADGIKPLLTQVWIYAGQKSPKYFRKNSHTCHGFQLIFLKYHSFYRLSPARVIFHGSKATRHTTWALPPPPVCYGRWMFAPRARYPIN